MLFAMAFSGGKSNRLEVVQSANFTLVDCQFVGWSSCKATSFPSSTVGKTNHAARGEENTKRLTHPTQAGEIACSFV